MLSVVFCLVLGLVLVAAAGMKAVGGVAARAALATYGVRSPRVALRAAALALGPVLPRREPTTDEWLAIGLGFALAAIVALGAVVLALAREIGMLRLSVAPRGALEFAHEGPEIGAFSPLKAE